MIVFHIGASGDPTKRWKHIADEVDLIGFEPRIEAWEELENLPKVLKSQKFYKVGIAGRSGERLLYETRDPNCSSFLLPNIELLKKWQNPDRVKISRRLLVPVTSLDDFCETTNIYPDTIVLDTQGTELEILQNFNYLDRVEEIEIEVSYVEIYRGQPLFQEVDEFLVSQGFRLTNLRDAYWGEDKAFGDALYTKEKEK